MKMNASNIESYLLLYIDNELSIQEKIELELFLKDHPIYQKALAILQQTVLTPEIIVYDDKAFLYRFEALEASLPNNFKQGLYRKEAPIVKGLFTNKRILSFVAIAAMLLVVIGYQWINTIAENGASKQNNLMIAHTAAKDLDLKQQNNQAAPIQMHKAKNNIVATESTNLAKEASAPVIENQSPIVVNHSINSIHANSPVASIEITELPVPVKNTNTIGSINNAIVDTKESFENVDTDDPDRIIYIANLEIDGDKLRGITRRVNAFLRRNKTEKEK